MNFLVGISKIALNIMGIVVVAGFGTTVATCLLALTAMTISKVAPELIKKKEESDTSADDEEITTEHSEG